MTPAEIAFADAAVVHLTREIAEVYHFTNGMTLVFDQHGEQMPEFQGRTTEVLPMLRAAGWDRPVVGLYSWTP
ncbi:hypothetical protein [Devosia sp. MC521]|uniref:hypothetical protein n=1 Tax=Devosia sp. MC521 TaxID=2759954 RepID=UPI0015F8B686|nr:hypothetical protein [Devosia sp. MC521]MBJ6986047.1 hypothetical protein [Devosia sp. MC521]QMW61417.1 hypothetical protein H4N61_10525 [Devosia sp. MC521]